MADPDITPRADEPLAAHHQEESMTTIRRPVQHIVTLVLAVAAGAACSELPTAHGTAAQFARSSGGNTTTYYLGLTLADRAGDKIVSDGKSAVILGVRTASSYVNGECGVAAAFNGGDVIADISSSGGSGKKACVGRSLRITLDQPANGGPGFGTVSTTFTHIKLQELMAVTTSALVNGGFNQLSGVGDCSAVRYNTNFGGDPLLATRTKTRGTNGSDRNEWVLETTGEHRAACMNAALTAALRHYVAPVKMTVTQLNY
jgi:hypothetical protein